MELTLKAPRSATYMQVAKMYRGLIGACAYRVMQETDSLAKVRYFSCFVDKQHPFFYCIVCCNHKMDSKK